MSLFDQKEKVFEIQSKQNSKVTLKFRVKWLHNKDMLELDRVKASRQKLQIEFISRKDKIEKIDRML